MTSTCDYAFYTGTFHGNAITQPDFLRLATRAGEVIDQLTFSRIEAVLTADTDTATIDLIKMASCAVAEEIQKLEQSGGPVSAESVGNYSVSYLSRLSEDARYLKAARRYLWNTGLMYAGFNEDEGHGEQRRYWWFNWWFRQ